MPTRRIILLLLIGLILVGWTAIFLRIDSYFKFSEFVVYQVGFPFMGISPWVLLTSVILLILDIAIVRRPKKRQ